MNDAVIDLAKKMAHVDSTVTPCEPNLVSILATRSLICQHAFWWIIL